MPKLRIDLSSEEARRDAGLIIPSRNGAGTVPSTVATQAQRPAGESRLLIAEAARAGWVTRRVLCDALGRKKTPHLVELIEAMVADRLLARRQSILPSGMVMFEYRTIGDGR